MNLKHIKLTNGEEFIANIIEAEEEEGVMIMSHALKIVEVENFDEGYSYFAFRPLMSFTENPEKLHILNMSHVMVETNPSDNIMVHYNRTIEKMDKVARGGLTMEELEEASDEDYERYMAMLDDLDTDERASKETLGKNVLMFKKKKSNDDTFH